MIWNSKVMPKEHLRNNWRKSFKIISLCIILTTIKIIYCHLKKHSKHFNLLFYQNFRNNDDIEVNVLANGIQISIFLQFKKAIDLNNPQNEDYEFIKSV